MSCKTSPIQRSDTEMIESAKQSERLNKIGKTEAYYKMYNDYDGVVFFFNNPSEKTLTVNFTLELKNLMIQGLPKGQSSFSLDLKPKENALQILKPIIFGLETFIKVSYKFKLH